MKTSRVIHSTDVKWIGKTWAEFYKIKMVDRVSGYVNPDEDFQLEEEDQGIDEYHSDTEDDSEPIQVRQPQAEEPTEPSVRWKIMSQLLQELEVKLSQLQQEPDSDLD